MDIDNTRNVLGIGYSLLEIIIRHNQLAIFLGTVIFEESVVIIGFFLSAQGFFPIINVFIFSLLGICLCDSFWFFLGEKFLKVTRQWFIYERMSGTITAIFRKKPFFTWMFFKLLYGIKFFAIIYFRQIGITYRRFILYDIFGTIILLIILMPVGWLAGRGVYNFIPAYNGFRYSILSLFVLILVYNLCAFFIKKRLKKIGQ